MAIGAAQKILNFADSVEIRIKEAVYVTMEMKEDTASMTRKHKLFSSVQKLCLYKSRVYNSLAILHRPLFNETKL